MTERNTTLDPIWKTVPTADRYMIDGKRYVQVWHGEPGKQTGRLMPLADYAESQTTEKTDGN